MKSEELTVMKAITICFKPYLKPEEAMIYCNLGHTQLAKRLDEFGIYKTSSGYFKREDLDAMMSGTDSSTSRRALNHKLAISLPQMKGK